ncbi:MAG: Zn-dependent hydrolase [Acidobacteria bacterium]|uniref:Zn-dependent hydrolase n=1 Tax=Candidatus Polarisedimenticola svalbardensis TaxID=2886004 RepID=A0A8J6Y4A5_9BACT|nr:Zn-dependent hydrolase [Candidatus Polarisedimenticola svalbardensis]
MRTKLLTVILMLAIAALTLACQSGGDAPATDGSDLEGAMASEVAKYAVFELTADLSGLTENQKKMIPLLIEASDAMDEIFWLESYGDRDALLDSLTDPSVRRFADINYGPWDRLNGHAPFTDVAGEKPKGAGFYPADMTKEEFEAALSSDIGLRSLYSVVRRDQDGGLVPVRFHDAFPEQTQRAAAALTAAALLAEDEGFAGYLTLRAEALLADDYRDSDLAWLDMKDNTLDIVIGPIETYEDELYGYKAAHEAYLLLKDKAWSEKLAHYAALLPELQKGLPVPAEYKAERPGSDSDLNAYDVLYYAGHSNAGSKTIAINLPNDEKVQLQKGTRRLQLKNAMKAKFDKILLPISDFLIAEDQRGQIRFEAFFENVMFHEVAHGLGIKNTLNGNGTVREAMKDLAGPLEEGKADVLGLYMITKLQEMGEMDDTELLDNYVTYMAGIFRSSRFGSASAHGRANMAQFGFFEEMGAFNRDDATGTYRVDFEKMQAAVMALAGKILILQGDGDYDGVAVYLPEAGGMGETLAADLARLDETDIPKDIVFEQGVEVLGL